MPRRIRSDHPVYELRRARVWRARKVYQCEVRVVMTVSTSSGLPVTEMTTPCPCYIGTNEDYARTSGTRLIVCQAHFTPSDIVEEP